MQIQKRSMNWLPRASLYQEAETARYKRKAAAQDAIAKSESTANLVATNIGNTGEDINLTLRVAAARVRSGVNVKPKSA